MNILDLADFCVAGTIKATTSEFLTLSVNDSLCVPLFCAGNELIETLMNLDILKAYRVFFRSSNLTFWMN